MNRSIVIRFQQEYISGGFGNAGKHSLRIAIVHFGFMYSGGGERTAIYESILLRRMGHQVTCFAPAIRTDLCFPELISQIDLRGILPKTRIRLPFRDFASLVGSSILAPLFARKFRKFDVILSHGQPATWISYLISRLVSKPHVTYLHQATRFLHPRQIDLQVGWRTKPDFALLQNIVTMAKPLMQAIDHVSIVSSDRVLVNSQWIANSVRRIYEIEPVVCSPGVDTDIFIPLQRKGDIVVNGHLVRKPFILSTNRHYPQKGLGDLIKIYSEVRKSVNCNLVVTGAYTNYTPFLREMCSDFGVETDVLFTGQVTENDLARLYQNADVYAFTSPEEDFGLGPIEAMAAGTPVVVWDNAGPSETVIDGVIGLKAKPGDLHDFAAKLTLVLTHTILRRRLSASAARHVKRKYSWTNHVERLVEVLADAAK